MNCVEDKIMKTPPDKFSIVFGAWTTVSTHYAAIYSCFPSKTSRGYEFCLLGFVPYADETKIGANALYE